MKNLFKIVILLLFCANTINARAKEINTYKKEVNGITFTIDPRIELYNIIAMQAGHHGMTKSNISYKQECLDYFSKYKDLEAPKLLIQTWKNGWGVDDPMFFMLRLDNNFDLTKIANNGIIERGGGIEHITRLAQAIKEFAQKSDFVTFFNGLQEDFYQQILSNVAYNFRDFRGIEYMEQYYGETCDSYNLVLNINGGYGNFGTSIATEKGNDLYAIVETNTHTGDIPTYHPTISIIYLVFHEFGHGFVNPVLVPYNKVISKTEDLYKPIAESMKHQAYWSWYPTVNEHIVNAVVTRLAEQYYGQHFADITYYKLTIARRFIYTDAIIERLKVYEENRHRYKTFKKFMPELLKVFETISEDYIVEKQNKVESIRHTNIEKVPKPYEYAKDSTTYFIMGTHEKNKEQEKQMQDFVVRYRNMISKKINIITDNEALKADLSHNDIVVFGTPSGNSFLKKYIDQIPVKITEDYILTNKIIKGDNLQLVTSWVNPFNSKKVMTIYTAQKTNDIKNFNTSRVRNIYHYWIAKNLITLEKGDYEKYSRVWMPKVY